MHHFRTALSNSSALYSEGTSKDCNLCRKAAPIGVMPMGI